MYNTPPQIFRIELIDVSNVEKCELHWLRKFCFLQRAFFFFLNNDVTLIWLNSHSFNQTTVFDWQNSTKKIHQAEILLQPFWRAAFTKQVARWVFQVGLSPQDLVFTKHQATCLSGSTSRAQQFRRGGRSLMHWRQIGGTDIADVTEKSTVVNHLRFSI